MTEPTTRPSHRLLALVIPRNHVGRALYFSALFIWTVALATHHGIDMMGFLLGMACGIAVLTGLYWICWFLTEVDKDLLGR